MTATLWTTDELPERTRTDWIALRAALDDQDDTDRARMIRAKARGARWYCPNQCTGAQGDECACPCGRECHGAQVCIGH